MFWFAALITTHQENCSQRCSEGKRNYRSQNA